MCKSMNRAEFTAIMKIAKKLGWKSVNFETISQMVRNQQALELDCVGECDDFEETLLSIALWDRDKIISTMYVSDYTSLVMWNVQTFCDDMGFTMDYFSDLQTWMSVNASVLATEYEQEEMAMYDAYCDKWENFYC